MQIYSKSHIQQIMLHFFISQPQPIFFVCVCVSGRVQNSMQNCETLQLC